GIVASPQSKRDRLGLSVIVVAGRIMQSEQLLFVIDLPHTILNDVVPDIAVHATSDQGPEPSHRDACPGPGGCGNSFGELEAKLFDLPAAKDPEPAPEPLVVPVVPIPIPAPSPEATLGLKEPVSEPHADG